MLSLRYLYYRLLYKNQLEFLSLNKTYLYLDSNIFRLTLNIMYEDLTLKIMNEHVFENVISLHLVGSINRIQIDLFVHFKKLKSITLIIDDLQAFFHNSIDWISYLNKDVIIQNFTKEFFFYGFKRVSFVQFVETESPFVKSYIYPDKDLCIFRNFPHTQLVYPIIIMFL